MRIVDIAGNLTNKAFREDLPSVLARAEQAGLAGIVVAGVSASTSRRGVELVDDRRRERSDATMQLVATAGIHPHNAREASPAVLDEIAALAARDAVVAVGECGLDYNRDFSPRDVQRRAFEAQLEIAVAVQKPVYLHERDAHDDFARILEHYRARLVGGVVHCFTGDGRALDRYLAMDLHVGFTGWLCDERRGLHLRELVRRVPRGRLLVETDAPYILPRDLAPRPKSGRNEPAFVNHVATVIARARDEGPDDLARHTTAAATALFGHRFLAPSSGPG